MVSAAMDALEELKLSLREFAQERDWNQFHSPKNLAMALAGETGELIECLQWLTEEQSSKLSDAKTSEVADEIADVQLYLIRLADKLNIDIASACRQKIEKNAKKYPINKSHGSAKKYTEL